MKKGVGYARVTGQLVRDVIGQAPMIGLLLSKRVLEDEQPSGRSMQLALKTAR